MFNVLCKAFLRPLPRYNLYLLVVDIMSQIMILNDTRDTKEWTHTNHSQHGRKKRWCSDNTKHNIVSHVRETQTWIQENDIRYQKIFLKWYNFLSPYSEIWWEACGTWQNRECFYIKLSEMDEYLPWGQVIVYFFMNTKVTHFS